MVGGVNLACQLEGNGGASCGSGLEDLVAEKQQQPKEDGAVPRSRTSSGRKFERGECTVVYVLAWR